MYKKPKFRKSRFSINESSEGETIEQKFTRILNNNEPLTDGAMPIFTPREDGVLAGTDIRTDRWEVALEGQNLIERSKAAERAAKMDVIKGDEDGGAESTDGTNK